MKYIHQTCWVVNWVDEMLMKRPSSLFWDTEFIRQGRYWPELALIQVAYDTKIVLIDPLFLEAEAWKSLFKLWNSGIIHVFFSARQDLQALFYAYSAHGEEPFSIFPLWDVQYGNTAFFKGSTSCSYRDLVQQSGIIFQSASPMQCSNWLMRPLSEAQLAYAQEDVKFLHHIYESQHAFFKSLGVWEDLINEDMTLWNLGDFSRLVPSLFRKHFLQRIQKCKKISERDRALKLFEQREILAQHYNIPRDRMFSEKHMWQIIHHKKQEHCLSLTVNPSLPYRILKSEVFPKIPEETLLYHELWLEWQDCCRICLKKYPLSVFSHEKHPLFQVGTQIRNTLAEQWKVIPEWIASDSLLNQTCWSVGTIHQQKLLGKGWRTRFLMPDWIEKIKIL
jgi:ribonuclease D